MKTNTSDAAARNGGASHEDRPARPGDGALKTRWVVVAAAVTLLSVVVPSVWTSLAQQERRLQFQAWVGAVVVAQARAHGVAEAARLREQTVPFGTALTVRTADRTWQRSGDDLAPVQSRLPLDPSLGNECPRAGRALIIHRALDRDGLPFAVIQRTYVPPWPAAPWACAAAGVGLCLWLLCGLRQRWRLAALFLSLGTVAPTVALAQQTVSRWRSHRDPGNWVGVAHLASRGGTAVGAVVGCDRRWTHSATLIPGDGRVGRAYQPTQHLYTAPGAAIVVSHVRWLVGMAVAAVLWLCLSLGLSRWVRRAEQDAPA